MLRYNRVKMGIPIRRERAGPTKSNSKASGFKNNYVQVRCSDQVILPPSLETLTRQRKLCPSVRNAYPNDIFKILYDFVPWRYIIQHGEELQIRIKARCPFQMLHRVMLLHCCMADLWQTCRRLAESLETHAI